MKKVILLITLLSCFANISAQEVDKGWQFHGISFAPFNLYYTNRSGGFAMNLDLSVNSGSNIVKIYGGSGMEFRLKLFGESVYDSFTEIDVLYGREIKVKEWMCVDAFVGAGYFKFNYDNNAPNECDETLIGFPLQNKIRFNVGKVLSFGLQLHANINRATSIYQPGLFVQYRL